MAVFLFLLAITAGAVVGVLVTENTTAATVTVFGQTISGYTHGQLLAMAAALGFIVALLLAASVGSRKARRTRRRALRTAKREVQEQMAGLEDENLSLWDKLADPEETGRRGSEPGGDPDLRRDPWTSERGEHHRTVMPDHPQGHVEPLYEQSRRAARLHGDHSHHVPPTDGYGPERSGSGP
jgi:hypothetical protein